MTARLCRPDFASAFSCLSLGSIGLARVLSTAAVARVADRHLG